jgi:hypothetical protein
LLRHPVESRATMRFWLRGLPCIRQHPFYRNPGPATDATGL